MKEVLSLLKRYNFELNLEKSLFLKKQIEYLGYVISSEKITLSSRHTEAVRNFPQPRDVAGVQRFLGLASYFRKFIKDFANKTRPLQNLLRKTAPFDFDQDCLCSFNKLKAELTAGPVLALYSPTAETQVHTDASKISCYFITEATLGSMGADRLLQSNYQ